MTDVALPTIGEITSLNGLPQIFKVTKERLDPVLIQAQIAELDEKKTEEKKAAIDIYKQTTDLINQGEKLKAQIDQKCGRLKATSNSEAGSKLWQAMFRTFGKGSNTVTYDQYVQALEMYKEVEKKLNGRN